MTTGDEKASAPVESCRRALKVDQASKESLERSYTKTEGDVGSSSEVDGPGDGRSNSRDALQSDGARFSSRNNCTCISLAVALCSSLCSRRAACQARHRLRRTLKFGAPRTSFLHLDTVLHLRP